LPSLPPPPPPPIFPLKGPLSPAHPFHRPRRLYADSVARDRLPPPAAPYTGLGLNINRAS
ncbi:MAG: hypothetical protein ACK56I_20970, partial [bacterium]